jgi:hypothetical protein
MGFHPRPAAPDLSGLFSPYRHCRAVSFHIPVRHAFHLPVPLCSTPVTALLSSYGDSDSSEGLPPSRGLPASRHTSVETILLPNTPGPPTAAFTRYPSARWVSPYGVQTSPLASRLVGVLRPNRFRLLRTGLSPPVASHPASRRRSYLRLPGRRARAWRGLTPLYVCARGRTSLKHSSALAHNQQTIAGCFTLSPTFRYWRCEVHEIGHAEARGSITHLLLSCRAVTFFQHGLPIALKKEVARRVR